MPELGYCSHSSSRPSRSFDFPKMAFASKKFVATVQGECGLGVYALCEEFYFSGDHQWFCHLRLDSSPQLAKNYLLGELDKVSFPGSIRSDPADTYLLVKDKLLFWQIQIRTSAGYVCRHS